MTQYPIQASKRYRDMITGVLEFYQMKPVTPAEINTIKRLCIEASGNHVEFRTVNVIVKSYTRLNASKDVSIGRLLERYYIASHNIDKRQLFAVSDFVANFMARFYRLKIYFQRIFIICSR